MSIEKGIERDNQFKNMYSLEQLINETGINQYSTAMYFNDPLIFQNNENFSFEKLEPY
jgi:hypothetical protein